MTGDHDAELAELLKEVRRIEVQSTRLVTGVMAGAYNSVFRGSGIEFDEVREYVEGDDPRSVDWNVTARVGRPFIKTYVDERELTVLFLLDLSASMGAGFGAWTPRQMAARLCACLAFSAVRNNDRVGLVAFSERVEKFVPPRKGSGHALRIVRDCLALPARSERTDLTPALELAAHVVRRHAILFVVSDFLGDGWEKALKICARRHDVIAVRLAVPELVPPERGLQRLRDPETGQEHLVDWRSARLREAYAQRVAEWREGVDRSLRHAQVDCMDVTIPRHKDPDAVAQPILEFFHMREQRGVHR